MGVSKINVQNRCARIGKSDKTSYVRRRRFETSEDSGGMYATT